MTDPVVECRFCDPPVPIRQVDVIVGPAKEQRTVPLMIDVEPHPAGRVVVRGDGAFRTIARRDIAHGPAYRIHGRTACGGAPRPPRLERERAAR